MSPCVRVATVCQNGQFYPTIQENRQYVLNLLDLALVLQPDLVCLPETFTTAGVSEAADGGLESVPGLTVEAVAERARKHGCYVICPIKTCRQGQGWNSAIVLGRQGEVLGIYDKAHPVTTAADYTVMEHGLTPGAAAPPVFDLDFGRVGIQICFDAGFPESWQELADRGVRLVVWPSAYNGGFSLQAYAYLHHIYVVSAVQADSSRIINPLGQVLAHTDSRLNVVYQDINLDFCVCHYDFNYSIPDLLMAHYGERVAIYSDRDSGHFLVEPRGEGLTVAQLQREWGFESSGQYHQRHRQAYAALREGRPAEPQLAAHGARPQYARWSR